MLSYIPSDCRRDLYRVKELTAQIPKLSRSKIEFENIAALEKFIAGKITGA